LLQKDPELRKAYLNLYFHEVRGDILTFPKILLNEETVDSIVHWINEDFVYENEKGCLHLVVLALADFRIREKISREKKLGMSLLNALFTQHAQIQVFCRNSGMIYWTFRMTRFLTSRFGV
jgi:hypothetical protein